MKVEVDTDVVVSALQSERSRLRVEHARLLERATNEIFHAVTEQRVRHRVQERREHPMDVLADGFDRDLGRWIVDRINEISRIIDSLERQGEDRIEIDVPIERIGAGR